LAFRKPSDCYCVEEILQPFWFALPVNARSLGADDSRGLLERIEMLERSAFPQGQVFKRVMDFLEANVAGQL
jgi:hypothetical protein